MTFIVNILAWIKGLSLLSKVAAFIPGGQIVSMVSAAVSFIGTVIKWTWDGIQQCFTHPATFMVCGMFAIGGAYGQAKWGNHRLKEVQAEIRQIKQERIAANKTADDRQRAAEEAGKRAAEAEKAAIEKEKRIAELEQ